MIYEHVETGDPIRQGDIFINVPYIEVDLTEVSEVTDSGINSASWRELLGKGEEHSIVVGIKAVTGIVISQDCDNARGQNLSLATVINYADIFESGGVPSTPKKWQSKIVQMMRTNPRYFYLPIGEDFGIKQRAAVDLRDVLKIDRVDLESHRDLRVCRLNKDSLEHFQRTISHFFTRYPVNEWYVLDKEEYRSYAEANEGALPFPWQC